MKRAAYITAMIIMGYGLFMFAGPAIVSGQQGGYGYGHRGDWNYCPYCGRSFHDPGGYGYGVRGPGMMGPGHGHMGDDYRRPSYGYPREPLHKKEAKALVEEMLDYSRNPNLKVGRIEEKGDYFEAEITTKDGSLVDKLKVDKDTGRMRSVY
jgi:hypothetical protein